MSRVLCIAAHPDDEVLGVGGTLLRHKVQGDEVSVALLYECEARTAEEQRLQSIAAATSMDIPYNAYAIHDLDAYVLDYRPDIVYTHSRADLHQDHQDALQRALVACRPQSGVRAIYSFETPSATDWSGVDFQPRLFVKITSTIGAKMRAMRAYDSEMRDPPHPRNIHSLYARAEYWGQRAGVDYAEAFEVIRECW